MVKVAQIRVFVAKFCDRVRNRAPITEELSILRLIHAQLALPLIREGKRHDTVVVRFRSDMVTSNGKSLRSSDRTDLGHAGCKWTRADCHMHH